MKIKRVLVVEDSPTMRLLLEQIIEDDPRLVLAASYDNAEDAVANVEKDAPDVVSMDVLLPGMDGLTAMAEIMSRRPTPVVIVSTTTESKDVGLSLTAMKKGALAVMGKPMAPDAPGFDRAARAIADQLYRMSNVKVVRQFTRQMRGVNESNETESLSHSGAHREKGRELAPVHLTNRHELIVAGASTGGPPALELFLGRLKPQMHVPMLIVQHIAPGFVAGLVDWLNSVTPHTVLLAKEGQTLRPGEVYVAPDEKHLKVRAGRLRLESASASDRHCPSVDILFQSAAGAYGDRVAGLLFTGMGSDGANGLRLLRNAGSWTATQSEASCVVYGMPQAADRLDASCACLTPIEMADALNNIKDPA